MNMFFRSEVVGGKRLGRTIDFPTANLLVDAEAMPRVGVYAARAWFAGREYMAMAYVGARPTVVENGKLSLEVNIIDFDQALYGQVLEVELVEFIRGEQRFDSLALLREQILLDKQKIMSVLRGRDD